ncbi:MAG TPA: ATP-binding cassette domain-containing protein [Candidatus Binatia bacterium]|nr:ATP-binding cassette domain-containing protein [Candidatus Binatia bacterium]
MPSAVADPHVRLDGVRMAFGTREVFRRLDCAFPRGRISCILGTSGSGKSTILRLVGGLIHPQAGHVFVDGEDVTQLGHRALFELRKKIGMMFQGGALLDSETVFDNLAFPLREHTHARRAEIATRVRQTLAAVGLHGVDDLLPSQLSGGMMRRVALARALIMRPVICLCDEPFSGLDPVSVRLIERLFQRVNAENRITMIVVSHDVRSTYRIADHVVLIVPGGEAIQGTPDELRAHPDPRVRAFLTDEVDAAAIEAAEHAAEREASGGAT